MPEIREESFGGGTRDSPWRAAVSLTAGIDRNGRDHEIQNADVSVQIECELHVREIRRGNERLLPDQKAGYCSYAEEINGTEAGHPSEERKAEDRAHVHPARDPQRARHPKTDGNRFQVLASVDVEVLARVQD